MRIYAGNLSYNLTEEQLSELFAEYGKVSSVTIITDKYTNRSKGFGFVEMPVDSEAEEAMEALDGSSVEGRDIKVNKAKPRNDRSSRPRSRDGRSRNDRSRSSRSRNDSSRRSRSRDDRSRREPRY